MWVREQQRSDPESPVGGRISSAHVKRCRSRGRTVSCGRAHRFPPPPPLAHMGARDETPPRRWSDGGGGRIVFTGEYSERRTRSRVPDDSGGTVSVRPFGRDRGKRHRERDRQRGGSRRMAGRRARGPGSCRFLRNRGAPSRHTFPGRMWKFGGVDRSLGSLTPEAVRPVEGAFEGPSRHRRAAASSIRIRRSKTQQVHPLGKNTGDRAELLSRSTR